MPAIVLVPPAIAVIVDTTPQAARGMTVPTSTERDEACAKTHPTAAPSQLTSATAQAGQSILRATSDNRERTCKNDAVTPATARTT